MIGGVLVLVVGPSGAGKDALLAGSRRELAGDPRFVFCRRVITRPRGVGESEAGIEERLSRIPTPLPPGVKSVAVDNSGSLEEGIERFVQALGKGVREVK